MFFLVLCACIHHVYIMYTSCAINKFRKQQFHNNFGVVKFEALVRYLNSLTMTAKRCHHRSTKLLLMTQPAMWHGVTFLSRIFERCGSCVSCSPLISPPPSYTRAPPHFWQHVSSTFLLELYSAECHELVELLAIVYSPWITRRVHASQRPYRTLRSRNLIRLCVRCGFWGYGRWTGPRRAYRDPSTSLRTAWLHRQWVAQDTCRAMNHVTVHYTRALGRQS
jgi:hypothetical protein